MTLKRLIVNWHCNITLIAIQTTSRQRKNLRRFRKLIPFFDAQKRAQYDQFGHAAFGENGPFAAGGFDFSGGFEDVFGDIFGEFFGGGGRRRGHSRGEDLRYNLSLKFEEAVSGTKKRLKSHVMVPAKHAMGRALNQARRRKHVQPVAAVGKSLFNRVFSAFRGPAISAKAKVQLLKTRARAATVPVGFAPCIL
jgi:molecular chaperone DnaJ